MIYLVDYHMFLLTTLDPLFDNK